MIRLIVFISFFLLLSNGVQAQDKPIMDLASKIANKMNDSLQLSKARREAIYKVNVKLGSEMVQAMKQSQNRDSISKVLQRIENGRDSHYLKILSSAQSAEYKKKKRTLVNNN